jgi:VanZ family protein
MLSIFRHKPDPLVIRQQTSGYGQIRVWLPTILAIVVIMVESTPTFGADHTGGWLRSFLEPVFGPMGDQSWAELNHILRKTGHFLGYGTVCLAFLRSWLLIIAGKVDISRTAWRVRSSLLAILSTAGIASGDEFHQTFLPNRTGNAFDVLLDSTGATCAVLIIALLFWRKSKHRRRRRRSA